MAPIESRLRPAARRSASPAKPAREPTGDGSFYHRPARLSVAGNRQVRQDRTAENDAVGGKQFPQKPILLRHDSPNAKRRREDAKDDGRQCRQKARKIDPMDGMVAHIMESIGVASRIGNCSQNFQRNRKRIAGSALNLRIFVGWASTPTLQKFSRSLRTNVLRGCLKFTLVACH